MERFSGVLRRAEAALRVPAARRSRILREVAQDLEDVYAAYRARGLGEAEATRRAETLLGLSDETVAELARLHATPYARLLNRFSTPGAHRLERALLAAATVLAVVFGAGGIVAAGGPRADSPVVWVLLALVAVVVGLVGAERLADLRGAAPRDAGSFGLLVAVAAAGVIAAALGAVLELWRLATLAPGERTTAAVVTGVAGAAEQLALGVIVALLAMLGGFHLRRRQKGAALERARTPGLGDFSMEEDES